MVDDLPVASTAEDSEESADGLDATTALTATSPVPASSGIAVRATAGARRRVERLDTPAVPAGPSRAGRLPSNAAALFAPLDPEDAAIPFDRVPYVPADLKRVAIMATCMVVIIIVAAIIVSHVVK